MSKIKLLVIAILTSVFIINCSESDSSGTDPEEVKNYSEELSKFFPITVGNALTYSVDTLNLSSNNYDNIGTRQFVVNSKKLENDYDYFVCAENYNLIQQTIQSLSKFRITENSLDFLADTSGVSALIPDSINMEIVLQLDDAYKLVEYPYADKHEWVVYKGSANFGTFKFQIFSIVGSYVGTESVELTNINKTVSSEKFNYHITLNVPNISNPLVSNIQEYDAYVWFSPEYGVVKLTGSALFVNPITGNKFNDADSNKIYRHTLVSFE
jgi:hypothetical protein